MIDHILEIDPKFLKAFLVSMLFATISMVTFFVAKKDSYTKIFWLEISNFCLLISVSIPMLVFLVDEISITILMLGIGAIIGYLFIWYGFKKAPVSNHGSPDKHD